MWPCRTSRRSRPTESQASALREEITTLAPCSAIRCAIAWPMPRRGAGDDGDFALHVEQAHVFLPYGFRHQRAYFDFRAKQSSVKFDNRRDVTPASSPAPLPGPARLMHRGMRSVGHPRLLIDHRQTPVGGPSAAVGRAGGQPEKGSLSTRQLSGCTRLRVHIAALPVHANWRLPMVNQQPWMADASHAAMHQPAGPEVVPATKLA